MAPSALFSFFNFTLNLVSTSSLIIALLPYGAVGSAARGGRDEWPLVRGEWIVTPQGGRKKFLAGGDEGERQNFLLAAEGGQKFAIFTGF